MDRGVGTHYSTNLVLLRRDSSSCLALEVFQMLGNCLGTVVQMNEAAITRRRFDAVHLEILRVVPIRLPRFLLLVVKGLQFQARITSANQELDARIWQLGSQGKMQTSSEKTTFVEEDRFHQHQQSLPEKTSPTDQG